MDAITILERCRRAPADIRRLELQIRQRRDALTSISAPQGDPDGGSRTKGAPDKIALALADIDALEDRLQQRKQRQAAETAAACVLLDRLPELPSAVLYGYYVRREDTPAIGRRLRYTASYMRRMKGKGEELLAGLDESAVREALPRWYLEGGEKP